MFKLLFIKRYKSKVLAYIDEKSQPKFSRELPFELGINFHDKGPGADSFDALRVADAMRSYLKKTPSESSIMSNANISFVEKMEQHIKEKNLTASAVYRGANIDRRLFSKIRCNRNYQPSKDTALALIFALKLTLTEAKDLLERAGYTLSHSIRRDIILEYFIKEGVYNLNNINAFLYNVNERIVGRSV